MGEYDNQKYCINMLSYPKVFNSGLNLQNSTEKVLNDAFVSARKNVLYKKGLKILST